MRPRVRWPWSVWLLGVPGGLCVLGAAALLAGWGSSACLPPLLSGPAAALALLVSGLALLGSAAFPLAIARLMAADQPDDPEG